MLIRQTALRMGFLDTEVKFSRDADPCHSLLLRDYVSSENARKRDASVGGFVAFLGSHILDLTPVLLTQILSLLFEGQCDIIHQVRVQTSTKCVKVTLGCSFHCFTWWIIVKQTGRHDESIRMLDLTQVDSAFERFCHF
jgi:hypothetical protein